MKDLIISHIKDIDGVSPLILLNVLGVNYDYKLLDVYEVENYLDELLKTDLSIYNNIYITDLTVPQASYKLINESNYKNKFKVFDHHKTHLYASNLDFVTIDISECGTTLFYNYLKTIGLKETKVLNEYVNSVKNLDLWLFEQNKDCVAPKLGNLFDFYGVLRYIIEFTKHLKEDECFKFNEFEEKILEILNDEEKIYIDKRELRMTVCKYEDYNVGIVFAEKYRSELGNELLIRNKNLDFVVIINLNGGISLRSREVDVSVIASKFNGGGHKLASGFGISEKLKKDIISLIFKGEIKYED